MKWKILATFNPRGVDLTLPPPGERPYVLPDNPQVVSLTFNGAYVPEDIIRKVLALGRPGLVKAVGLLLGSSPHLDDFHIIEAETKEVLL